ncbi:MAG: phospholipase D-like domain-containing protein, partial [Merismopediaceae bacterium]|nr:phospholipase D-like domain-containing protein [Merismopediaceae bacterium]
MLPTTWFETRITLEQIRENFSQGQRIIRIACGFFTLKGWGLIKRYTENKIVLILVGIDEPGEERARTALIKEIMRHLALGRDAERRQNVIDLVERIEQKELNIVDARASSHHGKLYLVDNNIAIVGSANTTGRGFLDQIEAGALYSPSIIEKLISENKDSFNAAQIQILNQLIESQVANYIKCFDEYFRDAHDITQELLILLRKWLDFSLPWDVYLKTILALEQIPFVKNDYAKKPVSYQQDMIAEALRQIREHGGSMLVASTGLGKTVMGTHIAIQLQSEG